MTDRNKAKLILLGGFVVAAMLAIPKAAFAHCDGMDGPVVKAAQRAIATGNVNLVLIWVQPEGETTIRTAVAVLGPLSRVGLRWLASDSAPCVVARYQC